MKRAVFALLLVAACGDGGGSGDDTQEPDAMVPDEPDAMEPEPDAMPPGPDPTFTSFVIDQIVNQTASDSDPVPYSDFEALPDPDSENENAYDSLF